MKLPLFLRKKFMILAGIYFGLKNPHLNDIMLPITEELDELCYEGIE